MTIYGLLTFCAVYALAVAAPGPGIAAVIARGLAHGLKGTPAFIAGFMVGDLVWFAIAATGLAALAKTAATAFVVIKWIGVAYLLYLAWKLWSAPAERVEVAETDGRRARLARVPRKPAAHARESQDHPVLRRAAAHGHRSCVDEPGALRGDLRGDVSSYCRRCWARTRSWPRGRASSSRRRRRCGG